MPRVKRANLSVCLSVHPHKNVGRITTYTNLGACECMCINLKERICPFVCLCVRAKMVTVLPPKSIYAVQKLRVSLSAFVFDEFFGDFARKLHSRWNSSCRIVVVDAARNGAGATDDIWMRDELVKHDEALPPWRRRSRSAQPHPSHPRATTVHSHDGRGVRHSSRKHSPSISGYEFAFGTRRRLVVALVLAL